MAWGYPWSPLVDPRSRFLDRTRDTWARSSQDAVLFGVGGFSSRAGATFSGQARAFGRGDEYWHSTDPVSEPVVSRLPARYGYDIATVHTAELCALDASLRWRLRGHWNMYIGDRSALFSRS